MKIGAGVNFFALECICTKSTNNFNLESTNVVNGFTNLLMYYVNKIYIKIQF